MHRRSAHRRAVGLVRRDKGSFRQIRLALETSLMLRSCSGCGRTPMLHSLSEFELILMLRLVRAAASTPTRLSLSVRERVLTPRSLNLPPFRTAGTTPKHHQPIIMLPLGAIKRMECSGLHATVLQNLEWQDRKKTELGYRTDQTFRHDGPE